MRDIDRAEACEMAGIPFIEYTVLHPPLSLQPLATQCVYTARRLLRLQKKKRGAAPPPTIETLGTQHSETCTPALRILQRKPTRSLSRSRIHSRTPSLTHSFSARRRIPRSGTSQGCWGSHTHQSLTRSITLSLAHSLTHALPLSLTHSPHAGGSRGVGPRRVAGDRAIRGCVGGECPHPLWPAL